MKPVFIFSLPRSGSTLLQRILASHTEICSTAEPWVLLPYIYARKKEGLLSEYSHLDGYKALNEFVEKLPRKDKDFNTLFRQFIGGLYEGQCANKEIYFIDKTPRYYLIIPEIAEIFADAKFIFLFRNPAHVIASIISTFGQSRLNRLHSNLIDIQEGPGALAAGFRLIGENSYRLRYEDLVTEPERYVKEIFDYLQVRHEPEVLYRFGKTSLDGSMGDTTGSKKYSSISAESLETWSTVVNSSVRKRLVIGLLDSIEAETFALHGYSKQSVIDEVSALNVGSFGIRDMLDLAVQKLVPMLNLNLLMADHGKWTRKRYLR